MAGPAKSVGSRSAKQLLAIFLWLCTLGRTSTRIAARSELSRRGGRPGTRHANIARTGYRDEYDFSKAEPGRLYRAGVVLVPPVHLEPDVLAFLTARAEARGVSLSELVNALLKKDIELIEAAE
jgi:hypothetical protein